MLVGCVGGPETSSKMMRYYIPMEEKGTTVVGDFKSQMVPENQLMSLVKRKLERALNENQENLRIFK